MSARPGLFIDLVETKWSGDRDSRIVSQAAFGEITGGFGCRCGSIDQGVATPMTRAGAVRIVSFRRMCVA